MLVSHFMYVSIYLLTFLASSVATGYSIQDTKDWHYLKMQTKLWLAVISNVKVINMTWGVAQHTAQVNAR